MMCALVALASATVTKATSGRDVETFAAQNIKNHHTYGLYFTEKEEGFMATVGGLFSSDKEAEFKAKLVDTDKISLMNINVKDEELKKYADEMTITEFPYIVVYYNGERDHNIHGVANEATANDILVELERIEPKEVVLATAQKTPIDLTDLTDVVGETPEEHDNHAPITTALEAFVDPYTGMVVERPVAIRNAPQPNPQTVEPIRLKPALESSGEVIDIRPKQTGDWMKEAPRHEEGYIEEVGHDDIFDDHVWAKQIVSALPDGVISYDIFPEPFEAEHVPEPEPVKYEFIEPVIYEAPIVVERPFVAPTVVERPFIAPTVVERPPFVQRPIIERPFVETIF